MGSEPRAAGKTNLMVACEQGRALDVKIILQKKPLSVASRDRHGKTALHYCAESGSLPCAQLVAGAEPSLLNYPDREGFGPLHLAVISGHRSVVKALIKAGADVDLVDGERHSCVHWAAVCGDLETLDLLLNHGANPSMPDILGAYPIHYSAQMCGPHSLNGKDPQIGVDTLKKLVKRGASVQCRDRDGREPLLWAASTGSSEAVLVLFAADASVTAADKDGLTALHCAASRGHTSCVETLVTLCGARIEACDNLGCTALFYAAAQGHADCVTLLLKHGAEPDRQDHKGRTPAHCAASKGQLEIIRILDSNASDLWIRNSRGNLPLHEAVQYGRKDLVQWLLQQHPKAVNATNINGRTPLHISAQRNNMEMSEVLIDYGAHINPLMVNAKGFLMSPLDVSVYQGNQRCAKYLQVHGAVPATKVLENNDINRNLLFSLGNYAYHQKGLDEDGLSMSSFDNAPRPLRPDDNTRQGLHTRTLRPPISREPPADPSDRPSEALLTNVATEDVTDTSVHIHLSRDDLWSLWESLMEELTSEATSEDNKEGSPKRSNRREKPEVRQLRPILTNVYLRTSRSRSSQEVIAGESLLDKTKSDAEEDHATRNVRSRLGKELKTQSSDPLPKTQCKVPDDPIKDDCFTASSHVSGMDLDRPQVDQKNPEDQTESVGSDTEDKNSLDTTKSTRLRKRKSDGRSWGQEVEESETSSGYRPEQRGRNPYLKRYFQRQARAADLRDYMAAHEVHTTAIEPKHEHHEQRLKHKHSDRAIPASHGKESRPTTRRGESVSKKLGVKENLRRGSYSDHETEMSVHRHRHHRRGSLDVPMEHTPRRKSREKRDYKEPDIIENGETTRSPRPHRRRSKTYSKTVLDEERLKNGKHSQEELHGTSWNITSDQKCRHRRRSRHYSGKRDRRIEDESPDKSVETSREPESSPRQYRHRRQSQFLEVPQSAALQNSTSIPSSDESDDDEEKRHYHHHHHHHHHHYHKVPADRSYDYEIHRKYHRRRRSSSRRLRRDELSGVLDEQRNLSDGEYRLVVDSAAEDMRSRSEMSGLHKVVRSDPLVLNGREDGFAEEDVIDVDNEVEEDSGHHDKSSIDEFKNEVENIKEVESKAIDENDVENAELLEGDLNQVNKASVKMNTSGETLKPLNDLQEENVNYAKGSSRRKSDVLESYKSKRSPSKVSSSKSERRYNARLSAKAVDSSKRRSSPKREIRTRRRPPLKTAHSMGETFYLPEEELSGTTKQKSKSAQSLKSSELPKITILTAEGHKAEISEKGESLREDVNDHVIGGRSLTSESIGKLKSEDLSSEKVKENLLHVEDPLKSSIDVIVSPKLNSPEEVEENQSVSVKDQQQEHKRTMKGHTNVAKTGSSLQTTNRKNDSESNSKAIVEKSDINIEYNAQVETKKQRIEKQDDVIKKGKIAEKRTAHKTSREEKSTSEVHVSTDGKTAEKMIVEKSDANIEQISQAKSSIPHVKKQDDDIKKSKKDVLKKESTHKTSKEQKSANGVDATTDNRPVDRNKINKKISTKEKSDMKKKQETVKNDELKKSENLLQEVSTSEVISENNISEVKDQISSGKERAVIDNEQKSLEQKINQKAKEHSSKVKKFDTNENAIQGSSKTEKQIIKDSKHKKDSKDAIKQETQFSKETVQNGIIEALKDQEKFETELSLAASKVDSEDDFQKAQLKEALVKKEPHQKRSNIKDPDKGSPTKVHKVSENTDGSKMFIQPINVHLTDGESTSEAETKFHTDDSDDVQPEPDLLYLHLLDDVNDDNHQEESLDVNDGTRQEESLDVNDEFRQEESLDVNDGTRQEESLNVNDEFRQEESLDVNDGTRQEESLDDGEENLVVDKESDEEMVSTESRVISQRVDTPVVGQVKTKVNSDSKSHIAIDEEGHVQGENAQDVVDKCDSKVFPSDDHRERKTHKTNVRSNRKPNVAKKEDHDGNILDEVSKNKKSTASKDGGNKDDDANISESLDKKKNLAPKEEKSPRRSRKDAVSFKGENTQADEVSEQKELRNTNVIATNDKISDKDISVVEEAESMNGGDVTTTLNDPNKPQSSLKDPINHSFSYHEENDVATQTFNLERNIIGEEVKNEKYSSEVINSYTQTDELTALVKNRSDVKQEKVQHKLINSGKRHGEYYILARENDLSTTFIKDSSPKKVLKHTVGISTVDDTSSNKKKRKSVHSISVQTDTWLGQGEKRLTRHGKIKASGVKVTKVIETNKIGNQLEEKKPIVSLGSQKVEANKNTESVRAGTERKRHPSENLNAVFCTTAMPSEGHQQSNLYPDARGIGRRPLGMDTTDLPNDQRRRSIQGSGFERNLKAENAVAVGNLAFRRLNEKGELTVFNSSLESGTAAEAPPILFHEPFGMIQHAAKKDVSNLEKPGFLWVHFGSGSSPINTLKRRPNLTSQRYKNESLKRQEFKPRTMPARISAGYVKKDALKSYSSRNVANRVPMNKEGASRILANQKKATTKSETHNVSQRNVFKDESEKSNSMKIDSSLQVSSKRLIKHESAQKEGVSKLSSMSNRPSKTPRTATVIDTRKDKVLKMSSLPQPSDVKKESKSPIKVKSSAAGIQKFSPRKASIGNISKSSHEQTDVKKEAKIPVNTDAKSTDKTSQEMSTVSPRKASLSTYTPRKSHAQKEKDRPLAVTDGKAGDKRFEATEKVSPRKVAITNTPRQNRPPAVTDDKVADKRFEATEKVSPRKAAITSTPRQSRKVTNIPQKIPTKVENIPPKIPDKMDDKCEGRDRDDDDDDDDYDYSKKAGIPRLSETAKSSSLDEGDVKFVIQRKLDPELSIKIKVTDPSRKRDRPTNKDTSSNDLSSSQVESDQSTVKDSGYVSTLETINSDRRSITIDLGHTTAKINAGIKSYRHQDTEKVNAVSSSKHIIKYDSDTSPEVESANINVDGIKRVDSDIIQNDTRTDFKFRRISNVSCHPDRKDINETLNVDNDNNENIKNTNVEVQDIDTSKLTTHHPANLEARRSSKLPLLNQGRKNSMVAGDLQQSPRAIYSREISTSSQEVDRLSKKSPQRISNLDATSHLPGLKKYDTARNDRPALNSLQKHIIDGSAKPRTPHKEGSGIPIHRTYSDGNLQLPSADSLQRSKSKSASKSTPILHEDQSAYKERKMDRINEQTPSPSNSQKKGISSASPENNLKLPSILLSQPERQSPHSPSPRQSFPDIKHTHTANTPEERTTPRNSPMSHLKLPILQQAVRCRCSIQPHQFWEERRSKSAVDCVANLHFLSEADLAQFDQRLFAVAGRFSSSGEKLKPSRYRALRTQTLKRLKSGRTSQHHGVTFHVDHNRERNTFKLPTDQLEENKKWQVVFTIAKAGKEEEKEAKDKK